MASVATCVYHQICIGEVAQGELREFMYDKQKTEKAAPECAIVRKISHSLSEKVHKSENPSLCQDCLDEGYATECRPWEDYSAKLDR